MLKANERRQRQTKKSPRTEKPADDVYEINTAHEKKGQELRPRRKKFYSDTQVGHKV